jgi:hypothetical protein
MYPVVVKPVPVLTMDTVVLGANDSGDVSAFPAPVPAPANVMDRYVCVLLLMAQKDPCDVATVAGKVKALKPEFWM